MNSMKRQNNRIPKEELSRSLGAQYASGEIRGEITSEKVLPDSKPMTSLFFFSLRITADLMGGFSSDNQRHVLECQVHESSKLEVVKQEMTRVNINILGISELRWTGMGEFNSDDHYIYYCGQESLRRNGVAITVNRRVQNAVLGSNFKNDRMISVHFQGKPFNNHSNPSLCPNQQC